LKEGGLLLTVYNISLGKTSKGRRGGERYGEKGSSRGNVRKNLQGFRLADLVHC